ncbi:MAG TPA: VTT domain-containing protein [Dehalococcoidia bacterium]|nr:VTT domain-containing protein [Dehalococcoidia bacterium]
MPAPSHGDASRNVLATPASRDAARHGSWLERRIDALDDWMTSHPRAARVLATLGVIVAFVPGVVFILFDLDEAIEGFGLASVFLTNLISTATLFVPVPGITAAANVLIVAEAERSNHPWLVGIAGGAGMAIGEFTAYYAGAAGAHAARRHELRIPERFRPIAERVWRAVETLMHRWGTLTLFVLAAIPDPFFEIAGVTAGSVGMSVRRYFIAVLAGCIVRGLTLAYIGETFDWW